MEWHQAGDIQKKIKEIVRVLKFDYMDPSRIVCFRSEGSTSRARARIWSFPRVWQLALKVPPHYVIEVLSEHFDKYSLEDKERILIHELMHIPKNFSGALIPHRGRGTHINARNVEKLFQLYKENSR